MNHFPQMRIPILNAWILTGIVLGNIVASDEVVKESPSPIAPLLGNLSPDTSASGVQFFTKKTRLWLGRSQVICFYARNPIDEKRYFSFEADEKLLHVLIPPTLVPGTHIGYIRVRPVKEGTTRLTLGGNEIVVEIAKDTAAATIELTRPEIVTPSNGAAVWGKFAVGVDQINFSTTPPDSIPLLRLPDGSEMKGEVVPNQQPGPHLRYSYTVNAKSLHRGSNELYAVIKDKTGREIVSDPVTVVALEPPPEAIIKGECKDQIQTQPPPLKVLPPGPQKPFVPPKVEKDAKSVYGSVVSNPTEYPSWCMPVSVPAKGRYQMIVTACGEPGGNALPTLALTIDNEVNTATTSRLATTDWHRIAVGHPVTLTEGQHVLSVRFRNPFGLGIPGDHRHLYLARYELARLDQLPQPAATAPDPSMTTMQDPTATPFDQKLQTSAHQPTQHPTDTMLQGNMMMETQKSGGGAMMMEGSLLPAGNFHLTFQDPLDGQVIANQVLINAMAWWPDRQHSIPPTVELLLNGKVVSSVTSRHPRFRIDVTVFKRGLNTIALRGVLPDGRKAQSVTETLVLPPELVDGSTYRERHRFYVHDPAWGSSLKARISPSEGEPIATLDNAGDVSLVLKDSLQGPYKLSLEGHGKNSQGLPVATLLLRVGGKETKIGDVPSNQTLENTPALQFNFPSGPKSLVLRLVNDTPDGQKVYRRLQFRSISLEPLPNQPPSNNVTAAIAYPSNNAKVGMADAVVANVSGTRGIVHADLLIDGQPQNFNLTPTNGLGPVLFPLLTRTLKAGPHQLQVTARDDNGTSVQSAAVTVEVTKNDQEASNGTYARALFLLNRFGYGPESRELAAALTKGPKEWLLARLYEGNDSPSESNEQKRLHAEYPDVYSIVPKALQYLITAPNPVRARFLAWTENHFSTWVNKTGAPEKSREHDRFRELGIAPFPDLLLASATSPAMLIYLDQRYSVARRQNENYAREIMELHTLGVKGGYTQGDVTALADLLTGWSLADEAPIDGSQLLERTFRYDPYLNSDSPETILGMEFSGVSPERRFDRVLTALNMLSGHPSCALFISRKLAEHYLSDPAPPDVIDDLARIYMESGGDMRMMLAALPDKPAFWTAPARAASPIDFGVRLARLAGLGSPDSVNALTAHSGMGLFDRATPDGYPDTDGYFISSNSMLQRWNFAQSIQNSFLANGLIPDDWKPSDHAWDPATTQRLIDLAAIRITGNVLTPASNASALQLIASAPENTDGRIHLLTSFICQTPEIALK